MLMLILACAEPKADSTAASWDASMKRELLGEARAAERAHAVAAAAYRRALDNWHRADSGLADLAEARKGVAGG